MMKLVTDHAVRRWFERVEEMDLSKIAHRPDQVVLGILRGNGVDVELRRGFIARLTFSAIRAGARRLKWQGYQFVIADGQVVTIMERGANRKCSQAQLGV